MKRQVKHSIYHRGLETHSSWRPQNLLDLELLLKTCALFSRSIIVPDSDLNNHPLLREITGHKPVNAFEQSIQTGFIRRAARQEIKNGQVAYKSQQEVYENFQRNNAEMARAVPPEHPKRLDKLFRKAEIETQPLLWSLKDAANAFANRMELGFKGLDLSPTAQKIVENILSEIGRYRREGIEHLSGAAIQKYLPGYQSDKDQRAIWKQVLSAYNGNLLASYQGNLSVLGALEANLQEIPAGPVPNSTEDKITEELLLAKSIGDFERFYVVGVRQVSPSKTRGGFFLDLNKLRELSVFQIEELREKAQPDSYFDERFTGLGNAKQLQERGDLLNQKRMAYWENLERAGIVLWQRSLRQQKAKFVEFFVDQRIQADQREILSAEGGRLALDTIGQSSAEAGLILSALNLAALLRRKSILNQANAKRGKLYKEYKKAANWIFQNGVLIRPDFRVVERIVKTN